MKVARAIFFSWLPLAGATTGILLVCYAGIQQNYRQSLNDPQIQMAEDGAAILRGGGVPAQLVDRTIPKDIGGSLAPWLAVYDASGTPLEADAVLDNAPPRPPAGIFDVTRKGLPPIVGHHLTIGYPSNENRLSWQPSPGVRQAIVIVWVPEKQQFVVAGRNMREVESRTRNLGMTFFLGWLALMVATLFAKALERYFV